MNLEADASAAGEAETEARYAMHEVIPTTLAGLTAYVLYWENHISEIGDDYDAGYAIPTIAAALQALCGCVSGPAV